MYMNARKKIFGSPEKKYGHQGIFSSSFDCQYITFTTSCKSDPAEKLNKKILCFICSILLISSVNTWAGLIPMLGTVYIQLICVPAVYGFYVTSAVLYSRAAFYFPSVRFNNMFTLSQYTNWACSRQGWHQQLVRFSISCKPMPIRRSRAQS